MSLVGNTVRCSPSSSFRICPIHLIQESIHSCCIDIWTGFKGAVTVSLSAEAGAVGRSLPRLGSGRAGAGGRAKEKENGELI